MTRRCPNNVYHHLCKGTTCPVIPTLFDNPSDPPSALLPLSITSTTNANDVRARTDIPRIPRAPSRTCEDLRRPSRTFERPSRTFDDDRRPFDQHRSPSRPFEIVRSPVDPLRR